MKKTLFCLGALMALAITGCNSSNSTPAPHVHSYDKENVEWAWSETSSGGYTAKAIFTCGSCEDGTEGHVKEVQAEVTNRETTAATCSTPGTITYTATVNFENQTFTATRDKNFTNPDAHHYVEAVGEDYIATAATCTEDATYYKSCEYCHEKSTETFVAQNTKLNHHLVHHDAAQSTCTVQGNIEYYECDRCDKLFLDANAANETTLNDVKLPLSHKYVEVVADKYLASEATCTADTTYYKSCEYCEAAGEETFTVPNTKLGHNMTHHSATNSTCSEHGHIEYYECDRCDKFFTDSEGNNEVAEADVELPLEPHDMTYHPGEEATCTTDGSHGYYTCSYEDGVLYKDENGNEKFNDESELFIEKLGHSYDETFHCIHCSESMEDILELKDTTGVDAMSPVTLSDIGIASGTVVPNAGDSVHLWGSYDYIANDRGIDLWIKVDYPKPSGNDYYSLFYLFSDGEEGGIVFRFGFSRTEDDGIIPCYVYTQNDYSANPGTTVVHTAGSAGTKFWLPRSSGVKSTTSNILHLTAYCIDESTNLYRCAFTAGVEGGTQWNLSTNPEDQTNAAQSFDICLGANYFDNGAGRKVRISCNGANIATIYDAASEEKTVVYKDDSGNVLGKLENQNTAVVPQLTANNKVFLGWFDSRGNRPANGDEVSSKLVLTPRFVDAQTNMFVPSDTIGNEFAAAKGGWYESTSFSGECGGQLPVSQVTDRYDFYFVYHFVSKSANDNYAIFGLPFDFTDQQTRLFLRIDNPEDTRLKGYIYGSNTNLGSAESAGPFSSSGFRANKADLLIHIAVYNASVAGLTLLVEITNLGDGQVYQTTREVTFNDPTLYAIDNPSRNIFDILKVNCEYRITDAF